MDPRPCIVCGTPFTPDKWHPNTTTCSQPCRDKRDSMRKRAGRAQMQPPVQPEVTAPLDTDTLLSELHSRGYYALKADVADQEKRYSIDLSMFDGDTFKFAVLGDTHYCSKQQQRTHLLNFYHYCNEREGITDFFNGGDVFNGSGRQHKGQEYENFIHGEDEQLAYVVSDYPKLPGCTTRMIGGTHDYSFYKDSGSDILKRLAEKRDDIEYLGFAGAYINLTPNVDIYLYHPDGGTSYALSYQAQRKVENFTPENKPNICFFSHYHRALYMPCYRNVETLLVPCFQSQTPFLKSKNIYPVIVGWIVTVTTNDDGLARFQAELIRYYVPVDDDY